MARRTGVRSVFACIVLALTFSLCMAGGNKLQEYDLLRTSVGKRLMSEGAVKIGVNGKRVTFDGNFSCTGQIMPYGIWLVGPNSQMKLGDTVYSDEGEHAEFYWSGKADLSKFTDLAIYRLPKDNSSPGKGAIRILSLPVKSISAATGRAPASPKK